MTSISSLPALPPVTLTPGAPDRAAGSRTTPHTAPEVSHDQRLRAVAEEFEAVFLTEMLRHSGLGKSRESFSGGAGEEAFAGLLAAEQAKALVSRGGIGLSEQIFQALQARERGDA
ncbi:MAG: rod-binding protein [Pseudomonadota bacterium]